MSLAVIMGYVVAAVFLFCGIANTVIYMQHIQQTMTASAFVNGLAISMWPLALAAIVYLLTQIAILLERQCIVAENPPVPQAPAPSPSQPVSRTKSRGMTKLPLPDPPRQTFPYGSPAPAASTQPARPAAPSSLREAAAAAIAAAAASTAPKVPSSRRAPSSPAPEDESSPEDLTFFRID